MLNLCAAGKINKASLRDAQPLLRKQSGEVEREREARVNYTQEQFERETKNCIQFGNWF